MCANLAVTHQQLLISQSQNKVNATRAKWARSC